MPQPPAANPAKRETGETSSVDHLSLLIAIIAAVAMALHIAMLFLPGMAANASSPLPSGLRFADIPLLLALGLGAPPLLWELIKRALKLNFGSDFLAAISIVTACLLGEYLAGTMVVLMLSGGEALEQYAIRKASSVLAALARRMPAVAHRLKNGELADIALFDVEPGDTLQIFPHDICPVDGTVVAGFGSMDESFLTGEPYRLSKAPGSPVLSGAINGANVLTIRAERKAVDSRYSKIMRVMEESEQNHPPIRRLADKLGSFYTPLAIVLGLAAWWFAGDSRRFLAVLVVATPCPLIIAIPVALIGAISLSARRGIIIRDPAILESISTCRTAIFDKTGTLTYGTPVVSHVIAVSATGTPSSSTAASDGSSRLDAAAAGVLQKVASLEQYSRHPLANAVVHAAAEQRLPMLSVAEVGEQPGVGLAGLVAGKSIRVTSRSKAAKTDAAGIAALPPAVGMECVVLEQDACIGLIVFRDQPRSDSPLFVSHLGRRHAFQKVMLVSGDRDSEVRYLAEQVGIVNIFAGQSPEQKVEIVRRESHAAPTLFLGDGINDAPALAAATAGIAFGQNSEITSEAADAVILETSLEKVDELFHISARMRSIALQSAVGGMALSMIGMLFAASGMLPPVAGAVFQELIDVFAVLNALRTSWPPAQLTDYKGDFSDVGSPTDQLKLR